MLCKGSKPVMVMIGGIDRRFTETVEVSNQLFTLCITIM